MNYLSLNFWHEQCSEYFIGFHFNLCNQLETETGEGNGNLLQYSCLEIPADRGAWWAAVHRVTQSQTRLRRLSLHACIGEGNGNPLQYSAWRIPGTEEPSGLPSMGLHRVRHDWSDLEEGSPTNTNTSTNPGTDRPPPSLLFDQCSLKLLIPFPASSNFLY